MAAGLPVVASNWNGYRDLVRHGVVGFLVPSRWASTAQVFHLAWAGSIFRDETFPVVAGALARLVCLDFDAAEKAVFSILTNYSLREQMGRSAAARAGVVCRGCGDEQIRGVVLRA